MLYSPQRQFIFVHIWKTAGKSVTETLRAFCPPYFSNRYLNKAIRLAPALSERMMGWPARLVNGQHLTAAQIRRIMPDQAFDTCFKFAFVRNPWDWQVSNYHYGSQTPAHGQHELIRQLGSFDAYIRYQHAENAPSQSSFLTDSDGELLVDFVGRFEHLERDFKTICERLGLDARLEHLNQSSRRRDWRSYYTKETRELVTELFDCDLKRFGYDWDTDVPG